MKTIVGLYDNMDDAQAAVNDLVQAGFDRADISLMAADRWAEAMDMPPGHVGTTAAASDSLTVADMPGSEDGVDVAGETMTSDVTTGAVTGGVVGEMCIRDRPERPAGRSDGGGAAALRTGLHRGGGRVRPTAARGVARGAGG